MSIAISQISSFCQSYVVPKLVDNVLLSNPLFYVLYKKAKKWVGGTYFECPVWHTKSTAEAFTDGTSLGIATVEQVTKAQYGAARYNVPIALEGLDLEKNKGTPAVLNLVKEKTNIAELSLKDMLGTDVIADYTSATSHPLYGLGAICKTGTTTLGGISSGDMATWKSSSGLNGMSGGPDATTTALTKAILDTHYNSAKIDNDQPDLLLCTDAVWSGISTTYIMPNMRYTDTKMADLGFENFKYRQATAYTDSHLGAGDLWFLNTRHLGLAIFPGMNFKFIPFDQAVNSDVRVAHIRLYMTMWCDSRRHQAWASEIATFV
jgi:hypothetical protein